VQYLLLVVFSIPGLLGASALLQEAAQLVGLGWALWLEWFAFRLTLGVARESEAQAPSRTGSQVPPPLSDA
jgi:threonine/homoserine/homoserine lactone efflux protein